MALLKMRTRPHLRNRRHPHTSPPRQPQKERVGTGPTNSHNPHAPTQPRCHSPYLRCHRMTLAPPKPAPPPLDCLCALAGHKYGQATIKGCSHHYPPPPPPPPITAKHPTFSPPPGASCQSASFSDSGSAGCLTSPLPVLGFPSVAPGSGSSSRGTGSPRDRIRSDVVMVSHVFGSDPSLSLVIACFPFFREPDDKSVTTGEVQSGQSAVCVPGFVNRARIRPNVGNPFAASGPEGASSKQSGRAVLAHQPLGPHTRPRPVGWR